MSNYNQDMAIAMLTGRIDLEIENLSNSLAIPKATVAERVGTALSIYANQGRQVLGATEKMSDLFRKVGNGNPATVEMGSSSPIDGAQGSASPAGKQREGWSKARNFSADKIRAALEKEGSVNRAAAKLGLSGHTLYAYMKRMGIPTPARQFARRAA